VSGRRPALFATLAVIGAISVAHARAVFGGRVYILKDILLYYYPTKALLRRRLLDGDIPHWGPELGLGTPLLADPGFAVFYPPNLALAAPFPWCVGLFLWVHLAIGALGVAALLRRVGVRWAAATFGGVVFALGGYCTSMLWVGTHLVGLAWLPGVLCASDAVAERRSWSRMLLLAGLWASQIASGEALSVLVTGALAGAWLLLRPTLPGERWMVSVAKRLGWLALSAVASACVAAVQLLPYLTLFSRNERRAGLSYEEAQHWGLHPARVVEMLLPDVYGSLNEAGSFFAYALDNEGGDIDRWPWMSTPYVGAVVLILAFAAWATPRAQRRFIVFLSIAASIAMVIAFGSHTPAFKLWFDWLPLVKTSRYPAKYFMVVSFAIPCLSAIGLDRLLDRDQRACRGVMAGSLAAVLAALGFAIAAPSIATTTLELAPEVAAAAVSAMRDAALVGLFPVVVAASLVLAVGRFEARWPAAALGALAAVDLAVRVTWPVALAPPSVYTARPDWLGPSREGHERRLYWLIGDVDIAGPSSPLSRGAAADEQVRALIPNTGLLFGVGHANLYTMTETTDEQRFWSAVEPHARAALDVFGMDLLVRPISSVPDVGPRALSRIASFPAAGVEIVKNPTALAHVYFAGVSLRARDDLAAIDAIDDPRVRSGEAVLLEGDIAAGGQPGPLRACRQVASADPDDVRARCETDRPGWAVFSSALYWGWRAEVDGHEVPARRANGRVIAVQVPPGRHDVVISYREPLFWPGVGITLAALSGLFFGVWLERRGPPRPRASPRLHGAAGETAGAAGLVESLVADEAGAGFLK
jgi:hypothetical protein